MRVMTVVLCGFGIATLCGFAAFGQRGEANGGVIKSAPTDKILVVSAAEISTIAQDMTSTNQRVFPFIRENSYHMEIRRMVGPQLMLQHAHKSDFMVVRDGEGTFMSGGQLVDGRSGGRGDADDTLSESIRGGVTQVFKAGDMIFVPAGIPHGFIEIKDHITIIQFRLDTK